MGPLELRYRGNTLVRALRKQHAVPSEVRNRLYHRLTREVIFVNIFDGLQVVTYECLRDGDLSL